jgi:hypothetical protein
VLVAPGGDTMLARIGVMRALNRNMVRVQSVAQRNPLGQARAGARSLSL